MLRLEPKGTLNVLFSIHIVTGLERAFALICNAKKLRSKTLYNHIYGNRIEAIFYQHKAKDYAPIPQ